MYNLYSYILHTVETNAVTGLKEQYVFEESNQSRAMVFQSFG